MLGHSSPQEIPQAMKRRQPTNFRLAINTIHRYRSEPGTGAAADGLRAWSERGDRTPCHGARGWRCEGVECAGRLDYRAARRDGEVFVSLRLALPTWLFAFVAHAPLAFMAALAMDREPGGEVFRASSAWTLSAGGKSGWSVPDVTPFGPGGLYRAGFDSHAHKQDQASDQ